MWVATHDLPGSAAHPFYASLNQILDNADFDGYVEALRERFYADEIGRPGLPPGRYFRLLLIGYFEGLDAERANRVPVDRARVHDRGVQRDQRRDVFLRQN
jgi:transposase